MAIIFLSIGLNMCFGCSKEPSHRDGSFEYPQHMFWMKIRKKYFQVRSVIWGPEYTTFLLGLKYGHITIYKSRITTLFTNFKSFIPKYGAIYESDIHTLNVHHTDGSAVAQW